MGKNGKTSIYIVEDNAMYTYFLNETLKEEGNFSITSFETAGECMHALDCRPDIVILDYFLEGAVTGMEVYKAIHAKYPGLPVIVLSNQKDVQVAADLMEAGVYEYIEKKDKEVVSKLKYSILRISNSKTKDDVRKASVKKVKHKNIYIVEDNANYALALQAFIKYTFPDVEKLKVFQVGELATMELDSNPSVIIVDYFLDGKYYDAATGLETIKHIKEKKPEANIILLSGQDDIDVALEATKKYQCRYVKKDEQAFVKVEEFIKKVW